jgi:hypothetical protein
MYKTFIILFFLISCNKVHEVHKKNGVHFLKDTYTEVKDLKNIEWDIGRKREVTISKGLRFSSTIPSVSEDSKELLMKKFGIDSWLIKISRIRRGHASSLGHFYIRLENMTRTTKDFTVNLYYHAASVSKKFRLFHCPAFNHRFELNDFSLDSRAKSQKKDLFIRPVKRLAAKANRLRFAPIVVSAGRSLIGKYVVDFALYNSKTKRVYTNWLHGDGLINITQEIARSVASCNGIKEENNPLPESKMPSIKDLQIK